MNDPEARRRELLRQTRKRYDDNHFIPAVHPRYGSIYHELYDDQESAYPRDTFLFRLTLGILCFICYVWMDSSQAEIASVSSEQIVNQIEKQWKWRIYGRFGITCSILGGSRKEALTVTVHGALHPAARHPANKVTFAELPLFQIKKVWYNGCFCAIMVL